MSKINIKYLIIIWIIVIFILSSIPGNDLQKLPKFKIPHLDKIVHFVMYFTLQFLVLTEYYKNYTKKISFIKLLSFSLLISVSYGLLMEILQNYFFISRTGSLFDFLANTIGAILGSIAVILLIKTKWFVKLIGIKN
jgi:VanZ family protein